MENLTHSLVGLALARAGLNRFAPHSATLLVLAANAPDADIVFAPSGALRYLEIHRGYSHCLLGLPVMAAICVLATAAIFRTRLPWLRMWLLACIGVASHLLLDWTNAYGIRLLLPFSSHWFHLDISYIYDWALLPVLLLLTVWPWFSSLISREIGDRPGRGRAPAIALLSFYLAFECFRGLLHGQALEQLSSRLYEGAPPMTVAALPSAGNPWNWTGIVETPDAFRRFDLNAGQNFDPESAFVQYKPVADAAIATALRTEPFRFFRYFSPYPAWSEQSVVLDAGRGIRVELADLRFGSPGQGSFHCVALVDIRGRVVDSRFTYGNGADLGYKAAK